MAERRVGPLRISISSISKSPVPATFASSPASPSLSPSPSLSQSPSLPPALRRLLVSNPDASWPIRHSLAPLPFPEPLSPLPPSPAPSPPPSPPAPPPSPQHLRSISRSPPPLRLLDPSLLFRSNAYASYDSARDSRESSPSHEPLPLPSRTTFRRRRRSANSDLVPEMNLDDNALPRGRRARQPPRSPSSPRSSSHTSSLRRGRLSSASSWHPIDSPITLLPTIFGGSPEYTTKPQDQPPSGLRQRLARGYDVEECDDRPFEVYDNDGPTSTLLDTYYPSPPTSPVTTPPHRKFHQFPVIVVPSLLPLATLVHRASTVSVSSASFISSKFSERTYYRELQAARTDAEFESVKNLLVKEWMYIGTFLVAKIAVDVTVLGYGSGLNFAINAFSSRALVISVMSAALGLVISVWFLFRCWCTNLHGFKAIAEGQDPIYIFFCLTSRLLALFSLISVGALTFVIFVVAYHVFPSAAITMCGGAWILLSLRLVWR